MNPPGPLPRIDNRSFVPDADHRLVGRKGYAIRLIVLHNTETEQAAGNAPSGSWLSTESPSGASTHHLYGRDGTRYDIVRRVDTAYHTGVSRSGTWSGDIGGVAILNLVSVGHELESTSTLTDAGNGYTNAQIYTLAYTVACELFSYGLSWSSVVSHMQIAVPSGRRHDPSHFPWNNFQLRTNAWLTFLRTLPADQQARWII